MGYLRCCVTSIALLLIVGCNSSNRPVELTVLTYNIHHGAGMDGKVDLPRIAKVIKDSGADVVALQEVDRMTQRTSRVDQCQELAKLTGMHGYFGKAMDFDSGAYGDAILSRYSLGRTGVISLPYMHQGKHEPRAAVFARLHTKGGEVMFVSTHLDHLGEPSDRPVQATAIMTSMQSVNIPAILAGDFNCTPGSEPLNIVEAHFTRVTDDAPSFPVVSPKSKIDHIFVHPAARWRIIETHVMDEEMASDHRPVVATLELLPTAR